MSRRLALVALVSLLVAFAPGSSAAAQEDVPGVSLDPVGTGSDDPNDGQWFVGAGEPGSRIELRAKLLNLAEVEQRVELYLVDMVAREGAAPVLGRRGEGMGTWGTFEQPVVVLGPRAQVEVPFTVTVPADADPGDHLGAVVVESAPQWSGTMGVLKRSASRLYVTVPGDASAAIDIESVDVAVDGDLLARTATVTVLVRNSGNVRLETSVRVGGVEATGSQLVMSSSTERFVVARELPLLGGSLRWPIEVVTRTSSGAGPTASAHAARFVFPWWVVLALFLLVVGGFAVRELRRRLR